ncbi:helix-turn-helix domain-containing protein [Nocardia sp. NPDC004068]|uniref:helix-turn-helix domain-containing protein n=1 Tax=Nocardia sp. NPDC004068 TaxID=3364303 RepID=UPI0036B3762A
MRADQHAQIQGTHDIRVDRRISVGEHIEMCRKERRLSRRILANLVGRSEEWLRLVETGRQPLDSVKVIMALADVLRIDDISTLISVPGQRAHDMLHPAPAGDPGARATIRALHAPPTTPGTITDTTTLERELLRCRDLWFASPRRHRQTMARLPDLLTSARHLRLVRDDATVRRVLPQIYNLTSQALLATHHRHEALLAADRALEDTLTHPGSLAHLVASWHLTAALLHTPAADTALRVASAALPEPALAESGATTDLAAVAGAVRALAARAAATIADTESCDELLTTAATLADRLGGQRSVQGVVFGPGELGLARMETALAQRNPHDAIAAAADTDLPADCPIASRSRYHVVLAHSFAVTHQDVAATYELTKAAACGEDELRYDADAQRTLQLLLRRENPVLRAELSRLTAAARPATRARPRCSPPHA